MGGGPGVDLRRVRQVSELPSGASHDTMRAHMIWSGFHFFPLISGVLSLGIGFYLLRRRDLRGALPLIVLFFASAEWSFGYLLELACLDLESKILWDNVQFLGYSITGPVIFGFVLVYTERVRRIRVWAWVGLLAVPGTTNALVWTDAFHGLVRVNPVLGMSSGMRFLQYDWGPWMWVSAGYGMLLVISSLGLLVVYLVNTPGKYRVRTVILLVGLAVPGAVVTTSMVGFFEGQFQFVDLSPVGFTVGYLIVTWGVMRHKLFSSNPTDYRTIFENVLDGIVVLDRDRRIVDINSVGERILNRPRATIVGDIMYEELAGPVVDADYFDQWSSREYETILLAKPDDGVPDGTNPGWRHVRVRTKPVRDRNGASTGWLVFLTDITLQKRSTEQLRILQLAVENANVSVVITDTDGTIEYVNPFFTNITGYAADESVGKNPRILKSGHHETEFYQTMWAQLTQGYTWRGELLNRRKDGSRYWEGAVISPVFDEHGEIVKYVGVKDDITDRKDLERLKEDVDRMTRHDMRSAIAGIVTLPQTVMNEPNLTLDQQEILELIVQSGRNLLNMINLSLTVYRIEQGTYDYKGDAFDVPAMLDQVGAVLGEIACAKAVDINITIEEAGTRSSADAMSTEIYGWGEQLLAYSVFANLLTNAIEASPRGNEVLVTVWPTSPIEVEIRNVGAVPEEIRGTFFEKYVTKGKNQGTGLGTYSAKLFSDVQGWNISMETSEEQGTLITLRIPSA